MKLFLSTAAFFLIAVVAISQNPKVVGDCTVNYSVTQTAGNDNTGATGSVKTVYIKGLNCRSDITSPSFSQSIVYNHNTGNAVILRTISQGKFITSLNAAQWQQQNNIYDGMKLSLTDEIKTILGYECKKAVALLKNDSTYIVWYATALKPSIQENPFQFKDVPGFVLEYEAIIKSSKITYTATKINFSPLPASLFAIPTSGYKELKPAQ